MDKDQYQSIGRSLKSDVYYIIIDLLKIIVCKNEEKGIMRQNIYEMWI